MEDYKASFSNGAKGNLHQYWNLCLTNECFCITWLIVSSVCECVCVFLSLFLALSLTTIFPPSFVPNLNLLNSVGFDVC